MPVHPYLLERFYTSVFPHISTDKDGRMEARCAGPVVSAYAARHQMVPICSEWWCTEANETTQTHCNSPVAPTFHVWAYYAHGRQHGCQEDPVSPPSSGLEKTPGRPNITWFSTVQQDLKQHHFTLPEAADCLWRIMYGAVQ